MSKALRGPAPLNPDNKKGDGIEPSPAMGGGDKGDRTPDLMTASHALSQLSYIPVGWCGNHYTKDWLRCTKNFGTLPIGPFFRRFLHNWSFGNQKRGSRLLVPMFLLRRVDAHWVNPAEAPPPPHFLPCPDE